jgi:two-component system, OmpR family, sensor histidine kinase QseC
MKSLFRPSLFRRLLFTTLTLIAALFLSLLAWEYRKATEIAFADEALAMPSRALVLLSARVTPEEAALQGEDIRRIFRDFTKPPAEPGEVQYAIFRGGKVWARSDGAPIHAFQTLITMPDERSISLDDWHMRAAKTESIDSTAVFALRRSFYLRVRGEGVVSSLTAISGFLVAIAVAAWIGSLFALRPIRNLSKRILALDSSRFEALKPENPHQELIPVIDAINQRTSAVKAQIDTERLFFSNAAHELRTPLAVIKTQAFGVERAKTSAERTERLAELQNGINRAAHALSRMLQLARLDSTPSSPATGRLKLGDVVADCVAFHATRAFAREQTLSLTEHGDAFVLASRDDILSIVDNLVENAINYAGKGAIINVETGAESGGTAYLSVTDNGPGFSPTDHATAFERFRRGSQADQHSGSGLGLAIVKAAAARIGGHAAAMDACGADGQKTRGLCVRVLLPMARSV